MKFVVFHGAFGSPEGNWFPQLKESLEHLGQTVLVPRFPVEDWDELTRAGPGKARAKRQSLDAWFKAFEKVRRNFKRGEKLCFIGHSLSCVFILHLANKYNLKLDSAIFVSPFLRAIGDWRFDSCNKTFYKKNFNFQKLRKLIPVSYVLYSDNDPYVDKKYFTEFAGKMHSSLVPVQRAGHMNLEVNLNEFPLVLELCKSRLDLTLYQRYLAHRKELFAVDYARKTEEIVWLQPKDAFDEGIFHFRNLRRDGFCTLFTATDFWDPNSVYMLEARKAAGRVPFTRVFVIHNAADLRKPWLLRQIRLDLTAGVDVRLVMWASIRRDVPEPDFGIWDNEYLCVVHFDKKKKAEEIKLSSRAKDLVLGQKWKRVILRKASRIYDAGAAKDFAKTRAAS